jgi:uncharacterized YigZ family protein
MDEFITIDETSKVEVEIVEKKSKFIGSVFYINSVKEAEEIIKSIKKKYHDAKHHCIAYRVIEEEKLIERSSDDGEPSGTAGSPMLSILQKNNLCNILIVVTRYFGGILLGTGGLVSCYSKATLEALDNTARVEKCMGQEAEVNLDYSNLESFKYYCKNKKISIVNIEYLDKIICKIEAENSKIKEIMQDIQLKKLMVNKITVLNKKIISKSK